jgi:Tol biopolymer transport system component
MADWNRELTPENDTCKSSARSIEKLKQVPPQSEIDLIDINSGNIQPLKTMNDSIRNLSWDYEGKKIFFMSDRFGRNYNQKNDQTWVYYFDIKNRELTTLLELDGLQQFLEPVPSHDGKYVAFAYDADNPLFNFMTSIGLISTENTIQKNSEKIRRLTEEIKLFLPKWSNDDSKIFWPGVTESPTSRHMFYL